MKSNLLKAERIKFGVTQKDMSQTLNIDVSTYSKKENGIIEFKASEICIVKKMLSLTPQKISEIFFENEVAAKAT